MLGEIFLKYVRCICMLLYVVCFYIFNFVFIYVLVYENLKKKKKINFRIKKYLGKMFFFLK